MAERELIAAYVSALSACHYCHGVHRTTAQQFGVAEGLIVQLLEDPARAPVEARIKPVLAYVKKLAPSPSRVTPVDAEAVFAGCWDELALHDAVSVCALFNFMNRLVDGMGLKGSPAYFKVAA